MVCTTSGLDENEGSENSPFATIQAGIDRANDGDTILVDEGVYMESDLSVSNKSISIISTSGYENTTIYSDAGLMSIAINDKTFLMDGFTMKEGSGNNILFVNSGTVTFRNMEFSNNGGLGNNNLFKGNGIDQTYFIDCIFKDNVGENNVGVTSATLIRCLFYDNQATNNPKPISDSRAINCVVFNTTWYPGWGGGEGNEWTAGAMHGGTAVNCIFWNNVGYASDEGYQQVYNAESVTYSNIEWGYEGGEYP